LPGAVAEATSTTGTGEYVTANVVEVAPVKTDKMTGLGTVICDFCAACEGEINRLEKPMDKTLAAAIDRASFRIYFNSKFVCHI